MVSDSSGLKSKQLDHLKVKRLVQRILNPTEGKMLVMIDDEHVIGMIGDVSLMNDEHLVIDRTVIEPLIVDEHLVPEKIIDESLVIR
ncbi:hypothetical protein Tco_1531714 [Tanacetum coccineum]